MELTFNDHKCVDLLKSIKISENLDDNDRNILTFNMDIEIFKNGDIIIKKGEWGSNFYIIVDGKIKATNFFKNVFQFLFRNSEVYDVDGNPQQQPISSSKLQCFQCFGALALFLNQQHLETIRAITELECAVIKKEMFEKYMVPMLNDLKQKSDEYHGFYV